MKSLRSQAARGLSLVEVTVALAILSVAILGSVKSLEGAAQLQSVTKERQAANMAASAQLNDLVMLGGVDETGWNGLATWNGTGFPVTLQAGVVGANADFQAAASAAAGSLVPALTTSTKWPAARAGASATVRAQAGFVQVEDVAGRDGLKRITVSVAWRSSTTGEEVVYLTQLLANPEL